MKSKTKDSFIHSFRNMNEDELYERGGKCAKHLLLGISFRETSLITYNSTQSALLPPIGYYYSLFHFGVAMLHLNYSTKLESLKIVRHQPLINMLKTELVQKKLLDEYFVTLLEELKDFREESNYSFAEFSFVDSENNKKDYIYNFFDHVDKFYEWTGNAFNLTINYINDVSDSVKDIDLLHEINLLNRIQIYIGDAKGDDLLQTYFSPDAIKQIKNFVLEHGLTT
jgi:hypothetical protein